MTEPRLTEHETNMLTDVVAGDRRPEDPEVAAAAAKNPEFRSALDELQTLQGRLDADGQQERDLIANTQHAGDSDSDPLVAATIGRLAAESGPAAGPAAAPARRPRQLAAVAALAAAALLLVWAMGGFGPAEPDDDDQQLGDEELTLHKSLESAGGLELKWDCSVEASTFTVTIYDEGDLTELPLEVSEELKEGVWKLDGIRVESLRAHARPENLRWQVTARYRGRLLKASRSLF